jgi:LAS superfamily LD-carboxypeptidase LdcB
MFNIVNPLVRRSIPFFAHNDFFQSPRLLVYVAQSSSTSTTPSTSHRSNNNMHYYINGKVYEFVTRTKFETSYSNVFSAYNPNTS